MFAFDITISYCDLMISPESEPPTSTWEKSKIYIGVPYDQLPPPPQPSDNDPEIVDLDDPDLGPGL